MTALARSPPTRSPPSESRTGPPRCCPAGPITTPAIHDFERTEWFRRDWLIGRARGGRRGARHVLPGRGRRRAAHRRPRPRRRPARASTTSAAIAARPSSRSRAARPSASSARTTPGSTTSTGKLVRAKHTDDLDDFSFEEYGLASRSGSRRGRGSCSSASIPTAEPLERLAGRPRPAPRPLRLRGAARRAHGDLRGRRELEVHRRELQRVLPLPGHPSAAQQADAVRPRRRLLARRPVAGRLDGARRRRRDDGARRRPPSRAARRCAG